MLTDAEIERLRQYPGLGWISALCHDAIRNSADQIMQLPLAHGWHHVKRSVRVHEHAAGTLSASLDGGARETAMRESCSRHAEPP